MGFSGFLAWYVPVRTRTYPYVPVPLLVASGRLWQPRAPEGVAKWYTKRSRLTWNSTATIVNSMSTDIGGRFDLGRRVSTHRRILGLTQAQLGALVGLSYQGISAIETGRTGLSISTATALEHWMSSTGCEAPVRVQEWSKTTCAFSQNDTKCLTGKDMSADG